MALVAYSDSEGSDAETPVAAPKPATLAKPAARAAPFQKTEARKIKVDLPALKPETPGENGAEEPPAKRAKTGGAFGGFNSLLPAPKRAAQTTGLKKGVSLKTSSEAAFSRAPPPVIAEQPAYDDGEETYDDFGNAPQQKAAPASNASTEPEVKAVGKATKFRPLSVANNRKKKMVKRTVSSPAATPIEKETQKADEPAVGSGATLQDAPPAAKPKKSLFSVQQEDDVQPEPDDDYEAIAPTFERQELPQTATQPAALASAPNSLDAIASDMNLTPAQRRQLFGRHAKDMPANITHFDMDAEYRANEEIRQSGETIEHRAVKTVAPGKHSLQQLVNNARTNQDSIEDKWAEGGGIEETLGVSMGGASERVKLRTWQ